MPIRRRQSAAQGIQGTSMGLVKKELARVTLPDREAHNSRMFIDLCENIHIHYREFRIVFSLDEYFEFADILERSTADVRSYLAQNPDYRERVYPTTLMVAGGDNQRRKLLQNSPAPNQSAYFANDFAIELQDESVTDEIHVHWRDYRFAMPREHLKLICDAFAKAKVELEAFEAGNDYRRRPHADRTVDDFAKERAKYAGYCPGIMGVEKISVADVRTRYDDGSERWRPDASAITHLVKCYTEGRAIAPIVVSTERNGEHYVIDGNHRLHAARVAGLDKIDCISTDLTFEESALFRHAEGLLKKFDRETGFRFNTSGFNRQFFAYRTSRYYTDHFHDAMSRTKRLKIWLKVKRRRIKKALGEYIRSSQRSRRWARDTANDARHSALQGRRLSGSASFVAVSSGSGRHWPEG